MRFQTADFGAAKSMGRAQIRRGSFGSVLMNTGDFGAFDQGSYKSNTDVADALQAQLNDMFAKPAYTSNLSNDLQNQYNEMMRTTVAPGTKTTAAPAMFTQPWNIMSFVKSPVGITLGVVILLGMAMMFMPKAKRESA